MSVTCAPRARMAEKAACPGVSRNVAVPCMAAMIVKHLRPVSRPCVVTRPLPHPTLTAGESYSWAAGREAPRTVAMFWLSAEMQRPGWASPWSRGGRPGTRRCAA